MLTFLYGESLGLSVGEISVSSIEMRLVFVSRKSTISKSAHCGSAAVGGSDSN